MGTPLPSGSLFLEEDDILEVLGQMLVCSIAGMRRNEWSEEASWRLSLLLLSLERNCRCVSHGPRRVITAKAEGGAWLDTEVGRARAQAGPALKEAGV